jgi:hypothetical protein
MQILRSVSVMALLVVPLIWQGCAGTTASGGAPTSYASCDGPGQCVAKVPGCCGVCGAPTFEDVVGVNSDKVEDLRTQTCRDTHPTCPKCAEMAEPNLVAFCEDKRCTAHDVRADAVSSCKTDDDCMLRASTCCESCGSSPFDLIAIARKEALPFQTEICGAAQACDACAPIYPAGLRAACGTNGHCKIVEKTNVCPVDQPDHGATCTVDTSLICEYGNDARPACRTHATCPSGTWQVAVSGCPPLPVAGQQGCPVATSSGGACSSDGLLCDMGDDTFCACSSCAGGPCSLTPRWACGGRPTTPGCASRSPGLGSGCTDEGLVCVYGPICVASVSVGRRCAGGVWVDEPLVCPL